MDQAGWKRSLANAVRDARSLLVRLQLPLDLLPGGEQASGEFPILVPQSFLNRMQPGDPRDPLLLQVLPVADELLEVSGFTSDPVGDGQSRAAAGLLHKYQGRALLIAAGSCAVHCRYCFRRRYPYGTEPRTEEAWEPALAAIRADQSLEEIILSGGDPLVLSDRRLEHLIRRLEEIPHVHRLRIHSRLPVVLPDRVTPELLRLLTETRLRSIFVIHANHARELTADAADAVERLVTAGMPVLNQAVLLRGVNDSVLALADLCRTCVNLGVLPYYLHQLDRVSGAAHFEVSESRGLELVDELRSQLPGYAIPRYVRERPGGTAKELVEE